MRIGFYGDSFCSDLTSVKVDNKYKTYIELLRDHYGAEVVNLGYGGGSHWDLIVNQFLAQKDNLPNVCVFCWTQPHRLYHRKVRHLKASDVLEFDKTKDRSKRAEFSYGRYDEVWNAALSYYAYLFDEEKSYLEYVSSIHYFDTVILKGISNIKFIHLWSFDEYPIRFTQGMEIRPSILTMVENFPGYDFYYEYPNHIPDSKINIQLFEKIKHCIDDYVSGNLLND
jgi:hypothetical protein